MNISRKHLPRRTFLKGLGAAIALPALDAMTPALARGAQLAAAAPPNRLGFFYVPNGVIMEHWRPEAEGAAYEMTRILKPFEAYRNRMSVVSGLGFNSGGGGRRNQQQDEPQNNNAAPQPQVNAGEDVLIPGQPGGHATAGSLYLTGVRPKKTIGLDVQSGTSVDQIIAASLKGQTRLPSLELSCDDTRSIGNCDGGYSCVYNNTICWRSPTSPMPPETNPRNVFERLFGNEDFTLDAATRSRRAMYRKSILDMVGGNADSLMSTLGASDKRKVDEYLYGIREIEKRIQSVESDQRTIKPDLDKPAGVPEKFPDHLRLMFDLQIMAWRADLTRVMTLLIGREGSLRTYPEIGVPESHHPLTHHRNDPRFIEKVAQINCYHAELFTYFLKKLKETPDGDGTLLDHCLAVYGSGISEGNNHSHVNLPTVIFGGGNGKMRTGEHIVFKNNEQQPQLYLTLMDMMGVDPHDAFGGAGQKLSALVKA